MKLQALSLLIALILAAGCSAETTDETEETPAARPDAPPVLETEPTGTANPETSYPLPVAPTPVDEGYPVPQPPPLDLVPGDYPAPIEKPPLSFDPYPGGLVAMLLPAGIQCEDPLYPDLTSALAPLEEAGIEVLSAREESLNVCQSCDCPTSKHYRVQIDPADMMAAQILGWRRE